VPPVNPGHAPPEAVNHFSVGRPWRSEQLPSSLRSATRPSYLTATIQVAQGDCSAAPGRSIKPCALLGHPRTGVCNAPHPGIWILAPLLPHCVHCAERRSMSLDASRPAAPSSPRQCPPQNTLTTYLPSPVPRSRQRRPGAVMKPHAAAPRRQRREGETERDATMMCGAFTITGHA
jgi:hypothetical protein